MTELEKEIAHLEELQAKHRRNIRTLEEMLADYGMERPLALVNNLEFEREQLRKVEEELAELTGQAGAEEVPAIPAEPAAAPPAAVQVTVTDSEVVAVGERATAAGVVAVGGDVHGNIYVGSPPADAAEALAIYRRVLVQASHHLPLRGVELGASDPTGDQQRFDLAQVYVSLDTKTQVPLAEEEEEGLRRELAGGRKTRPLGVLEVTISNHHLVILGDPGSGKSTFVNHLAFCLAACGPESEGRDWLARLPGWPETEANALPIPVILRDFARWLPEDVKRAEPCHLWDFIVSRLEAQNLAFAVKPLCQALEKGEAVVLLDGLDEIPTKAQRTFVRDAVAAFAGRYPRSRLAITCRTLSYQEPAWQLEGFPSFELAPFDGEKIDRFIEAWYGELARLGVVKAEEAEGLARRLREAVRRPDLWRLAPNPLLLTVMALVHTHKGSLPDARALLYEDTVDVLLWRWEQIKVGDEETAPRLRRLLLDAGRTDVDLKRALWRLAFEAHREGGAGDEALADVGELRLEKALAGLHPDGSRDWAHQVIEAMKLRAGLLLERAPEVYTFPHRTFQEYMAGAHLSAQADFARQAARLVEEGAFWREVVLLAVGRLVYLGGDTDKPLALVGELCPQSVVDDEVAWRKAWLSGEVLVETGLNRVQDSALGRDLAERVSHRLADLVGKGHLSPVERAAAGDTLAQLGDPRFREDAFWLPDESLLGFVEIPAGPFVVGTRKEDIPALLEKYGGRREWYELETPQHQLNLLAYSISKYPVTNAQYAAFVQDGGYTEKWRGCWTEDGWRWKRDRTGPETYGGAFYLPNHPVATVTWYEAVAFCHWLTERLRESGDIELGQEVTLPTEAQWEKTARGGVQIPNPKSQNLSEWVENPRPDRFYPWGDEFDPTKCNMGDTGIGTTSAVGIFSAGASPYDVLDLSGNVWEWCRTKWRDSYWEPADEALEGDDLRVVRGGSWDSNQDDARCASRGRNFPYNSSHDIGFRLVLSVSCSDF